MAEAGGQRINRRDLVKRGAVVGGTLLWAAPVIQSIGPAASAHQLSPPTFTCCECLNCPAGVTTLCDPTGVVHTILTCERLCSALDCDSNLHTGPDPITCNLTLDPALICVH